MICTAAYMRVVMRKGTLPLCCLQSETDPLRCGIINGAKVGVAYCHFLGARNNDLSGKLTGETTSNGPNEDTMLHPTHQTIEVMWLHED